MMKRLGEANRRFWRETTFAGAAQRRWFRFCSVCLALYVAYATCLAQSKLFMSAADTVAALLWFILVAAGVYALLLFACARLRDHAPVPARPCEDRRFFWISAALSLAILLCVFAAEYPGGVTYDASNQWRQAQSGEFNNWHPVFHTLCVWLASRIVGGYSLVLLLQLVAFSFAMAYLVDTARSLGAPRWLLLLLQGLVVASSIVRNTLMTVGKDGAMAIGALCLLAQTIRVLQTRGAWLRRLPCALCYGLLLAFTTMVRHNGVLLTLPLGLFALCCYPCERKRVLLSLGAFALCVALVQGPLYGALDIVYPKNTLEESVGIPMTILCNEKQKSPDKLDERTNAFLDGLASEEDWRTVYQLNVYNSIKFTFPREKIADVPASELLGMTLDAVKADPRNAFMTVNAVTDLVWGVTGANEGVEKVNNTGDIEEARYGVAKLNAVGKAMVALFDAIYAFAPLSWLFKNIGVQQLLLLLVTLWALARGGVSRLSLAVPAIVYNLATMLLLCGGDARFFMYFMAGAPFATLALLLLPNDAQSKEILPN